MARSEGLKRHKGSQGGVQKRGIILVSGVACERNKDIVLECQWNQGSGEKRLLELAKSGIA